MVRYAAAVHVVCREVGWSCNGPQTVAAYFDAYRARWIGPRRERARDRRASARRPHAGSATWLQWADALMRPMPASEEQAFRDGWPRFVDLMRETYPDRPRTFYGIVRAGRVELGIGSALEPKTLIRIAGPSDAPEDDVALEARITVTPDGRECVSRSINGGSLDVLMFTALLGPRLPEVFGFVPREGAREAPELWIQSWDRGYRELSLADLRTQDDLNELAADAGRQLAGHFWTKFPAPLGGHQRFAQLRAFEMTEDRARNLARQLSDDTVGRMGALSAASANEITT